LGRHKYVVDSDAHVSGNFDIARQEGKKIVVICQKNYVISDEELKILSFTKVTLEGTQHEKLCH